MEPLSGIPVVLSVPKDDSVLYTAVAAGADVLCTRDHDLHSDNVKAFCQNVGIQVMDEMKLH